MKKIVLLCILNVFIFSSVVNAGVSEFNDLENHWAKEDILFLINEGVVSGYPHAYNKRSNRLHS